MRRFLPPTILFACAFMVLAIPSATTETRLVHFDPPIDALSVSGNDIDVSVSGRNDGTWTAWAQFSRDDEDDPDSTESNLVIFDHAVSAIRLSGRTPDVTLHPIRVSGEPTHYEVAALGDVSPPRILSRYEWGADESLLYDGTTATPDNETNASDTSPLNGNGNETVQQPQSRVLECERMQSLYPAEFRISRVRTSDSTGRVLRWPQQYALGMRLIVVHHTGQKVSGDSRPGAERVRAIYQYHAETKGWGDIGYHYIIDEKGQMYQGRAGGEYVVGGHAYRNNIGTLGIALLGNFEVEQPTLAQAQSLQWLIDTLSKEYNLDLSRNILFHGKSIPPIVGHRDLGSTACPGYTLHSVLSQIRSNVQNGLISALLTFPPPSTQPASSSSSSSYVAPENLPPPAGYHYQGVTFGLSPVGSTSISGRPGMDVQLTLQYRTGDTAVAPQAFLGNVFRGVPDIGVWVAKSSGKFMVGRTLLAPTSIPAYSTSQITLVVRLPLARGSTTLKIGGVTYTLTSEGSRLKVPGSPTSATQGYAGIPFSSSSSLRSTWSASSVASSIPNQVSTGSNGVIRIRLTDTSLEANSASLQLLNSSIINGQGYTSGTVTLQMIGGSCTATMNGRNIASGTVRIDAANGSNVVTTWKKSGNRFRGVMECRVIEGKLALINELPLESYMAGLSEEPDTEPLAKQEAFAIAARSYAAYWMNPTHRKFPGMPYDGSDDPAVFQAYSGVVFETKNPLWVSTVQKTAGQVLTINGEVIRVPYFSSDDGRTRSPAEVGWQNFPHAEIFTSKLDPWCQGMPNAGHGVGMSGCGAEAQAKEGKSALQILRYYYPETTIQKIGA